MNATMTYEDYLELARKRSAGGWAAVVEVTRYLSDRPTTMTVAVSTLGPIKSRQRGGEFVGVVAQFRDGQSLYNRDAAAAVVAVDDDSDVLPF